MILLNKVRCHKCGDTPFSAHQHDFKYCACGSIAVDGGMSYCRRVGAIRAYDDMSIIFPDDICQEAIEKADQVIGEGRDYYPLELFVVLTALQRKGITIEGLSDEGIRDATASACHWTKDNGRNGLGALCAIARYVRDAGGVWKVPVDA
jgi:hypothetical protein